MNKREALSKATKRAKRKNPSLTWQQAKHLGERWCVAMWPDFHENRKWKTVAMTERAA